MGSDVLHFCIVREQIIAPVVPKAVRWIVDSDLEALARSFHEEQDQGWTIEEWLELRNEGYLYCGHFSGSRLCSMAGIWKRAPDVWEVIAVNTRTGCRRRGMARAVVHFAVRHILEHVMVASYTTLSNNVGSIHTAQSLGFRPCANLIGIGNWCALSGRPAARAPECPLHV